MNTIRRSFIVVLALSALIAGVSGCQKKEGPAERAGKEIDKAAEKTGQGINKAVDTVGDKMEKAGDKVKDATK
jgi:hypothetical protein